MVAERIPLEGSERAQGLGSEVGERLRKSAGAQLRGRGEARRECGGSEGVESWWRGDSEGVEGVVSPGCVQCTRMRGAVSVGEAAARECRVQRSRAIEH